MMCMPRYRESKERGQVEYVVLIALAVLALVPSVKMFMGTVADHYCLRANDIADNNGGVLAEFFINPKAVAVLREVGAVQCDPTNGNDKRIAGEGDSNDFS
jgi:hypothetical protein